MRKRVKRKSLHVPCKDASGVTESGKPAAESEGVKFLRMEKGAAVYAVGSGMYRFKSLLPLLPSGLLGPVTIQQERPVK